MDIPRKVGPLIDHEPGPWWRPVVANPRADFGPAHLLGPCGHQMALGKLHQVDASGNVTPSVVCPEKPETPVAAPADCSTLCIPCGVGMVPEHAHMRCPKCHERDACCW